MVSYKREKVSRKKTQGKRTFDHKKKVNSGPLLFLIVFLPLISSLIFTFISIFVVTSTLRPAFQDDYRYVPKTLIFKKEKEVPHRVVIPKVSVDRLIKEAVIQNGTWETFDDFVSYGLGSALPDELKGSTVMFAHARAGLFSRLDELLDGDSIYVLGKNSWYRYQVLKKIYVLPTETDFLKEDYGRSLILFTCYGPLDEKRVVIISKYIDGESV